MRTLHKGLAMLLVVIMVLGLGAFTVVAAPSDVYSDADQINETYKEAVDVLTHIGVLEGDNGFRPTDTLTRAEGAKILTAVMGVLNPTGTATTFTDVDDWAKGYVAYVEVNGISDGVAENLFGSQMKLTGSMFSKWLLVGLGYDAEIEGMTGIPWEINIAKLVRLTELDAALEDYDPTAEITREQAAQMALNALKTPMVEYDSRVTITSGSETISVSGQAQPILSSATYARNISADGNSAYLNRGSYVELAEQYWRDLKLNYGINEDDFGRPASTWTYKSVDIGTYVSYADRIFSSTKGVGKRTLYTTIGRSAYESIISTGYGSDYLNVYINGYTNSRANSLSDCGDSNPGSGEYWATSDLNGDDMVQNNKGVTPTNRAVDQYIADAIGDASQTGNGVLTELYRVSTTKVNGNTYYQYDVYTLVIINTYLVQATADYSSTGNNVKVSQVTENGQSTLKNFKNEISGRDFDVKDVKEGDYLLINYSKKDGREGIKCVEPATLVKGEVEAYVTNKSVTIDGTTYNYNKVVGKEGDKSSGVEFSVGSNAVLVMDQYGYIIAVDDADANANYLYVRASDTYVGDGHARVYFLDGTTKVIDVKSAKNASGQELLTSGDVKVKNDGLANKWFKYSVDESGRYTLTIPSGYESRGYTDKNYTDGKTISDSKVLQFLTGEYAYGTEKSVLLVLDDDGNVHVYEGVSNVPTVKSNGTNTVTVGYLVKDNYILYAFIDGRTAKLDIEDGAENKDLMFVLKQGDSGSYMKTNEVYVEYDVVINGKVEKNVKIDSGFTPVVGKTYTGLKYNSNGWLTYAKLIDNTAAGKKEYAGSVSDGVIRLNGNTLMLGGTQLNISGANLNLILTPPVAGATGMGLNSDYCPTTAQTISSLLSKYSTVKFDWFATYVNDCDANGSGMVKALYLYVKSASEVSSKITVKDWDGLKPYLKSSDVATADQKSVTTVGTTIIVSGNLRIPHDYNTTNLINDVRTSGGSVSGITVEGTLTNNSATGITIATGKLDVKGEIINNGVLTVNGAGTLECNGGQNFGTVNVESGSFTNNDVWQEFSKNSLHISGYATVALKGGVRVSGGRVDIGKDDSYSGKITIAGGITTVTSDAVVDITTLGTGSTIDAITATNGDVTIASGLDSDLTVKKVTIDAAGEVSIGSSLDIADLSINGELKLTDNAAITVTSSIGGTGKVTAGDGNGGSIAPAAGVTGSASGIDTSDGKITSTLGKGVGTIKLKAGTGVESISVSGATYANGTYTITCDAGASTMEITTNPVAADTYDGEYTLSGDTSITVDGTAGVLIEINGTTGKITVTVSTVPTTDWTATITINKAKE